MMSSSGTTSNPHKAFAVCYVDSQIKLNLLFIQDIFRNSLVNQSAAISLFNLGIFFAVLFFIYSVELRRLQAIFGFLRSTCSSISI